MKNVERFLLSDVGFDGGDLGDKNRQSIWLCGIERGGGYPEGIDGLIKDLDDKDYISLNDIINDSKNYSDGYEDNSKNFDCPYNQKAMKLLASLFGYEIGYENATKFNDKFEPFVANKKGFFKMNLFPIPFKNMQNWKERDKFCKALGLKNSDDYMRFCRENRYPLFKALREKYEPKIIICVGLTMKNEFMKAFGVDSVEHHKGTIDCSDFYYGLINYKSGNKGLFVTTRFLAHYDSCLNSDERLKSCGENIAKIAKENGIKL